MADKNPSAAADPGELREGAGRARSDRRRAWRSGSLPWRNRSPPTSAAPSSRGSAQSKLDRRPAAGSQILEGESLQRLHARRRSERTRLRSLDRARSRARDGGGAGRAHCRRARIAPARLHEAMRYAVLGRRQAGARRCWCSRPANSPARRHGACEIAAAAVEADPRLLAGARRHAVHGRRRAAPRQAHLPRRIRRGHRAAGGRRAAESRLPAPGRAHASRRIPRINCAWSSSSGRGVRLARHGGRAGDRPGSGGQDLTLPELEFMHIHKTGALIRASVLLGAHCGTGLAAGDFEHLDHYGKCVGLAFQVVDDVLDERSRYGHARQDGGQGCAQRASPPTSASWGCRRPVAWPPTCTREAHEALAGFQAARAAPARSSRTSSSSGAVEWPLAHELVPPARDGRSTRRSCGASIASSCPACRRAARIPGRLRRHDRRAPVVQPRHGGADHRAALRVQHAATTAWSGTSATRPTPTRSSPGGARACAGCARRAASPASRGARKAPTTPSARRIPRPRSPRRSAWRWRRAAAAWPIAWSRSSATAR